MNRTHAYTHTYESSHTGNVYVRHLFRFITVLWLSGCAFLCVCGCNFMLKNHSAMWKETHPNSGPIYISVFHIYGWYSFVVNSVDVDCFAEIVSCRFWMEESVLLWFSVSHLCDKFNSVTDKFQYRQLIHFPHEETLQFGRGAWQVFYLMCICNSKWN